MKILTWNINGIRATKTPLKEVLDSLSCDVICLQETKITRNMLDTLTAQVDGYNAYFSFSRKRSGYSGVVTYCRDGCVPCRAEEGLSGVLTVPSDDIIGSYPGHVGLTNQDLTDLDSEGRTVITQHDIRYSEGVAERLCIINVYCPRADPERDDRLEYKYNFYRLLQARSEALISSGCHVMIVGDINGTHTELDHCNPAEQNDQSMRARLWIDQLLWQPGRDETLANRRSAQSDEDVPSEFLTGGHFLDTFRHLYPTKRDAYTNWSTHTGARLTNYGRRLDYMFVDTRLGRLCLDGCEILSGVAGSDHCPVVSSFSFACVSARRCPSLCSKFMPEVIGRQNKLSAYFTAAKRDSSEIRSGSPGSDGSPTKRLSNDVKDDVPCLGTQDDVPALTRSVSDPRVGQVSAMKRTLDGTPTDRKSRGKRVKLSKEKSGQTSLMSFFQSETNVGGCRTSVRVAAPRDGRLCSEHKDSTLFDKNKRTTDKRPDSESSDDPTLLSSPRRELELHSNKSVPPASVKPNERVNSDKSQILLKWKHILSGPAPAPLCKGHQEACVLRTVKKADSLNKGRQFYVCAKPQGLSSNPQARCDHFQWI